MILLLHSGYISFLLFKYFACRWKNAFEWQQKVKVTTNMWENRIFIYVFFCLLVQFQGMKYITVYDFFLQVVGNILI